MGILATRKLFYEPEMVIFLFLICKSYKQTWVFSIVFFWPRNKKSGAAGKRGKEPKRLLVRIIGVFLKNLKILRN